MLIFRQLISIILCRFVFAYFQTAFDELCTRVCVLWTRLSRSPADGRYEIYCILLWIILRNPNFIFYMIFRTELIKDSCHQYFMRERVLSYRHDYISKLLPWVCSLCSFYAIANNDQFIKMSDCRFSKKTRPKLSAPRKKSRHNLKNIRKEYIKSTKLGIPHLTLENNDIQVSMICLV